MRYIRFIGNLWVSPALKDLCAASVFSASLWWRPNLSPQRRREHRGGTEKAWRVLLLLTVLWCSAMLLSAQTNRVRVGVSDLGAGQLGTACAARLAQALAQDKELSINDLDETQTALRGAGYNGSLNLSLTEAQDLGGATGSDYYLLGRTATEELSDLSRPKYAVSYVAILLVSSRTGRLILWREVRTEAATPLAAAAALPDAVAAQCEEFAAALKAAQKEELAAEIARRTSPPPLIPDAPDVDSPAAQGLRLPAPYRRLSPVYPASAARVQAAGTVDIAVELNAQGAVTQTEIVRWAGFGLDEAAADVVRRMNFRPAQRNGQNVPLRVLLRYNFRPAPRVSLGPMVK